MQKKVLYFSLILLGALFLLGLTLILTFAILIILNGNEANQSSYHQYTEINPRKREFNTGLVKLPKPLSTEDYVGYRNDVTGNYILISKIGGDSYKCTGSCVCKGTDRRSTAVVSRGLFLFLSAFSAATAMNMAKEAFDDECKSKAEDEDDDLYCDEEFDIESEVYDCKDDLQSITITKPGVEEDEAVTIFTCTGTCVTNFEAIKVLGGDVVSQYMLDNSFCSEMEVTDKVYNFCKELPEICTEDAKWMFANEYLRPHCLELSKFGGDGISVCEGLNGRDEMIFGHVECVPNRPLTNDQYMEDEEDE